MSANNAREIAFPIHSEAIEPMAAYIVGRMWARVEHAKQSGDSNALYSACNAFWYTLRALDKIAVGVSTATHFSIVMNNHIITSAQMIHGLIGINPMDKTAGKEWV